MSEIPMEKKLELVHQIRSQYKKNQTDLFQREQILYGRTYSREPDIVRMNTYETIPDNETVMRDGTFKIRLAISVVLLITVIVLDRSGKAVSGISADRLFEAISLDYGAVMVEWLETININTL